PTTPKATQTRPKASRQGPDRAAHIQTRSRVADAFPASGATKSRRILRCGALCSRSPRAAIRANEATAGARRVSKYEMPEIGEWSAGKYRLDKVAGEGGMGIVYAAEHLVLKRRVAVKVLLPDAAASDAVVERFAREARAAARINSEHVARVMD